MRRDVRYATSGDVQIAYDVFGNGPRDLVFAHGWVTNLELLWSTRASRLRWSGSRRSAA